MPQRFLRPGITNSERWNSVSWECQSLFIRILTLVDDYGRCDGRPPVLTGQCFSVWNALHPESPCNLQQVEQMLQQLAASRLIQRYTADEKTVIQVTQWQERIREGVKERFLENPNKTALAASCSKLLPSSPRTLAQNPRPEPSSRNRGVGEKFSSPSIEEVKLNGAKIGLPESECIKFRAYYESNGWRVGRNPMKSWAASMINWRGNWQERNNARRDQARPMTDEEIVREAQQ